MGPSPDDGSEPSVPPCSVSQNSSSAFQLHSSSEAAVHAAHASAEFCTGWEEGGSACGTRSNGDHSALKDGRKFPHLGGHRAPGGRCVGGRMMEGSRSRSTAPGCNSSAPSTCRRFGLRPCRMFPTCRRRWRCSHPRPRGARHHSTQTLRSHRRRLRQCRCLRRCHCSTRIRPPSCTRRPRTRTTRRTPRPIPAGRCARLGVRARRWTAVVKHKHKRASSPLDGHARGSAARSPPPSPRKNSNNKMPTWL